MKKAVLGLLATILMCVMSVGCSEKKQVLNFYTWADYIDPSLVSDFEEQNNCIVRISYFDSNESMLAKLRTSNVHYDVILPSTYTVDVMRQEKLIQPLNPELIPNALKYIDPKVAAKVGDPKLEYSVPYYQGFTGIGYNADKMPTPPDTWTIYGDPQFSKRISLLDDLRESIAAALMTLGYDGNSTDEAQLEEAKQLLLQWKANIAKFGVDDVKQDLRSGALYAIHGYAGDIFQISEEHENIRFILPKEGAVLNYDHLVIPANAANPELANRFINFLCSPDSALRNIEETWYIVPVPEAIAKIPDELRQIPGFLPSDEEIEKACVFHDLDKDIEKYTKIWNEVRAH